MSCSNNGVRFKLKVWHFQRARVLRRRHFWAKRCTRHMHTCAALWARHPFCSQTVSRWRSSECLHLKVWLRFCCQKWFCLFHFLSLSFPLIATITIGPILDICYTVSSKNKNLNSIFSLFDRCAINSAVIFGRSQSIRDQFCTKRTTVPVTVSYLLFVGAQRGPDLAVVLPATTLIAQWLFAGAANSHCYENNGAAV